MTMPQAIDAARSAGLGGICLSDHYDFDVPEGVAEYVFDPLQQQAQVDRCCREAFLADARDDFKILKGIEVGVQPGSMEAVKKLLDTYTFDTVIFSEHFVDGMDPYHGNYYLPYDYRYAYGHYLEELLECIKVCDNFDILGHYDYVARYSPYKIHSILYSDFSDVMEELLRTLAYNGKTFEINTKSYTTFAHGTPQLDLNILKRFRELGGEAVAFGSDAHGADRVGDRFDYFAQMVTSCGFRYHVHYQNRKPVFLKF